MTAKKIQKPNKTAKGAVFNVRCTAQQKLTLETIASHEGLGLSTWVLHTALRAAEERQARKERS